MTRKAFDLQRFKYPPPDYYTLHQAFIDYSHDRFVKRGRNPVAMWVGFNTLMTEVVNPYLPAHELAASHVDDFVELYEAAGSTPATAVKYLTYVKAAIIYAHRRKRIRELPVIEIPDAEHMQRRPLTPEEFKLVMRQKMSARLRRFYRLAFFTGHRARAIEELTWDRVDLKRRVIDFNVPGRKVTNKKRCADFPIVDEFLDLLKQWKAGAKDDYVIGLGERGVCSSTFKDARYVVRTLAGITDPKVAPRHCMRSTFATELFEKGANPGSRGPPDGRQPADLEE